MVELVVNGQTIELDDLTKIKYTAQISDIFDIAKVKSSCTNSFTAPKTSNNVRILKGLGLTGSTSNFPYEKVPVTVKENGFDVIVNGWLNIKETTDRYVLAIIDGAIDFYKDIENINIGDLDLSEINHTKTIPNIFASFVNENYRYIFGDYNGKNIFEEAINIDYQVPSARYKYLIEKIFTHFGWSKSGSIFSNEDYLESWITYPKPPFSEDTEPMLVAKLRKGVYVDENPINELGSRWRFEDIKFWDTSEIFEGSLIDNWSFEVQESNRYFINIKSKGYFYSLEFSNVPFISQFYVVVKVNGAQIGEPLFVHNVSGTDYQTTYNGIMSAGDIISFEYIAYTNGTPIRLSTDFTEVNISRNVNPNISFSDEFKDFKITDFFNDFLRRFGLTMIINTDIRHLEFYTLAERMNRLNSIDWSDKFIRRAKESYVTGSYAQRNYYKQKYNGDNELFSDGVLLLDNKNLPAEKTIYTSPFYSRTNILSDFIENTFVYPIWEREPKETEDGLVVSYKGLTGRWYVIKQKIHDSSTVVRLFSELSGEGGSVLSYPIIVSKNTHYADLVPIYYDGYQRLLNTCKIHEMEFILSELDRINLDFTKPIYVEAEASYYMLNKVTFEKYKASKVEAIKINY